MLKVALLLLAVYRVGCIPLESVPENVIVDDDDILNDGGEDIKNFRSVITEFFKESDPVYVDLIVGNLPTVNYTVSNINIRGLAKCVLTKAEINHEALTANLQWECPKFYAEGQYKIKGTILIINLEGNGEANIRLGKYNAEINANLVKYEDKTGESHYKIKNFSFGAVNFLEPITYYASNLFNGDTKLAEEALKFMNDNWLDVATILRVPAMNAAGKHVVKKLNAYLKHVPLEHLIN